VVAIPRMRLVSPPSSMLISPPSSWWQRQGRGAPPLPSLPQQPSPSQSPPAPAAAPGHSLDGQQGLQIMLQEDHADSLARARLTGALFAEARSYYQSIE